MFHSQRTDQTAIRKSIAPALLCSFFLSACGVESFPDTSEQGNPSLGAATKSATTSTTAEFTGELLSDGSIRLQWPRDPSAISYIVLSKGKVSANVPASVLSAVVKAKGKSAANGKFAIESVDASNVRSKWASNPTITTAVVEVPPVEEAPPVVEVPPVEETPPAVEIPPVEETPPVEEVPPVEETPPVEEVPPVEESPPVEEVPPVEESPPVEEVPPVEESPPVVEIPPVEETPPIEEAPPIGEAVPVEEVPPVEIVNLAPSIIDTSYNCDPIVESIGFTVGQIDHFTLSVSDESLLTLTYSFDTSKEGVVSVDVDSNGVFTISALQAGDTYLWLSVTDNAGLVDEFELSVVVQ